MPIYEYECNQGHRWEVFVHIARDYHQISICPIRACQHMGERVFSLCAMQPDTMWAGQNTNQGYFTSKSEYNKVLKEKNIEIIAPSELENVRKNVAKAKADKKEKQLNSLTSHLEKELANVEVSPDGNTIKEKVKFMKDRT